MPIARYEGDDLGGLPTMITAGRRRIRKTDVALASWTDDKALGRARQLYAGCSVGMTRRGGIWAYRRQDDGPTARDPATGEPRR